LAGPKPGPEQSADELWYFVSTALQKCTPVRDIFPKQGENYPSTPEGIIAGTGGGSAYRLDRPGYGPAGNEHHAPGPVVRLSDLLGFWPTLVLVQGEENCLDALSLMTKAATSGSAEQRWAAQNAARDAQWHVVFWNDSGVPCLPLSEFVPGAMTLEQAVTMIQVSDPDAYLVKSEMPDEWERIIRTQGHNLRVVRSQSYCRIWFSLTR
jgi:hypothetical protein